jgi:restriction endonuclease S subunit
LKTALKNIAKINTGIYTKSDAFGNTFYLQAKHFNDNGIIEILPKPEIWLSNKNKKHLLKTGDILFAAKGTKNFAAVFNENIGYAVASSTFLILRINQQYIDKVLPEFIVWWLNNTVSQKFLKNLAIGSALPSISKAALQELEIFIPDLNKQKMILKIRELRNKESDYILKIDKLRELLVQRKILNALNK